jgi:hypothetical protein
MEGGGRILSRFEIHSNVYDTDERSENGGSADGTRSDGATVRCPVGRLRVGPFQLSREARF